MEDKATRGKRREPAGAGAQRIEDVLAEQGVFVSTTSGTSMWPMLRNRRDTIVVKPLGGRRLRRFEVPLYRRGDAYVLHRCIGVHDGGYTMLGDNCISKEPNVSDERVIGVLAQCYRGGRELDLEGLPYRAYVRIWYALFPARRAVMRLRHAAGKVARRALPKRKAS